MRASKFRFGLSMCMCICVILSMQPVRAEIPALDELGRTIPGLIDPALGGFAVADFDGDESEDVLVPSSNGSAMFVVFGRTGDDIGIKQSVVFPDGYYTRAIVREFDGSPHVLILNQRGVVREFSGWPLSQVREFDIGTNGLVAMALGDIDADGDLDLVIANAEEDYVRAYDFATGALRWSMAHDSPSNVLLQQLDSDAALEIVLDGFTVRVIDGATQATDWLYNINYLARGLSGGVFEAGSSHFVTAFGGTLTAFQSSPYAMIWTAPTWGVGALATADLDGDGIDEIVQGDRNWGAVNVFNVRGDTPLLTIPYSGNGVSAVGGVRLGDEGGLAIAFASYNVYYSGDDIFRLVDGVTGNTIWKLDNAEPGAYAPVAITNPRGDGRRKLLYASQGREHVDGTVSQLDVASGRVEWRSPVAPQGYIGTFSFRPAVLQVVRRANASPIVVVAGSSGGGNLVAIDGDIHEVLWHVEGAGTQGIPAIHDVAVFDIDADGNDEVIACMGSGNDVKVAVFSSTDGGLQWISPSMNGGIGPMEPGDVTVGQFEAGRHPLIVAVLPTSIEAFDAVTRERAWTMPITADGLTLLDHGENGREFVTFTGPMIRFHDAATRALLREFDLGAPVLAVRGLAADIGRMLVAVGGRLVLLDGVGGGVLASSDFLGKGLGKGNNLAVDDFGGGTWLIGAGSEAGVFRLFARVTDFVFGDGFDGS